MKKASFVILTLTASVGISLAAEKAAPSKEAAKVEAPKVAQAEASKVVKATVPVAPKANLDFIPEVVAEVNGKKLTKAELIARLLGPQGKIPQGVNQEILVNVAKQIAQRFIQTTALLDAAEKAGFKPSPELAEKAFNDFLKKAPAFQLEQVKKGLARQGKTIEQFLEESKAKKDFQEQMAVNAFLEAKALKDKPVTDEQAKAYYDANPKLFAVPGDPKDSMRAAHILINVDEKADAETKAKAKAKAEKLLALLKKDPSLFGELAEKESSCPSKANKGSLGAFQKGQMVPKFEEAVVKLKPGEISDIVETKYGYHIIRRDALQGPKTKTFAEVKDKLKLFLKQKEDQEALKAFVEKTTDEAKGVNYIK